MRSFTKPASSQDDSRLLSLPFEIRTPILIYAVSVDEPIPIVEEWQKDRPKPRFGILRACQQLYQEGIGPFRQFNQVRVWCTLDSKQPWFMNWTTGRAGPIENVSYNTFLEDVVPSFPRIYVTFVLDVPDARRRKDEVVACLGKTMSVLKKLNLREKSLSLAFDPVYKSLLSIGDMDAEWVGIIGDIRCEKLYIEGIDETLAEDLTATVESRSRIPGIQTQCQQVLDHFQNCQRSDGSVSFANWHDTTLERRLRRAAELLKFTEYEELREEVFARCDELIARLQIKHERLKSTVTRK